MYERLYSVNFDISAVSAIKTLCQLNSGTATPLYIKRLVLDGDATAAAPLHWALLRKTAAASVTDFTPIILFQGAGSEQAAAAARTTNRTGVNASAEGTDGDILLQGTCNSLSGLGLDKEFDKWEIQAAADTFIALKIVVAPTSVRLRGSVVFGEMG